MRRVRWNSGRRELAGGWRCSVEEEFANLDDLVIPFGDTATGSAFVDAWFNARKVVDLGRRATKPNPAPAPPAK